MLPHHSPPGPRHDPAPVDVALAEALPQLVWFSAPDGPVTYLNQRWHDTTGVDFGCVDRSIWDQVLHPDDRAATRAAWAQAIARGEPHEVEFRLRHADGAYGWYLSRAVPVRDPAGVITKWIGTCTDISEVKAAVQEREHLVHELQRAVEQAEGNHRQLATVIEAMTDGVMVFDAAGKVMLVNERNARINRFASADEMMRDRAHFMTIYTLRYPDGQPVPIEDWPVSKALRGEMVVDWHLRVHRTDIDLKVDVLFGGAPVFDSSGQVALAVLVTRDITDMVEAETQLQEAVRLRDDFLSIASHELKTPLTSLELQLAIILRRNAEPAKFAPLPEWAVSRLEAIQQQAKRLEHLISEMLDVSRITSGRLHLAPESVDAVAVVSEVADRFSSLLEDARCRLQIEAEAPVIGWWDRSRLDQVVTNLLSNAIKYGAGQPVSITVAASGGTARLTVRDQGIGIAPESQVRIFERFERVGAARHLGGLGLGLWITKEIIGALGGAIAVESMLGEGATFIVELPQGSPGRR